MPTEDPAIQVRFHYIKGNNFRVIHVDGAVGAPLPNGKGLHMALFSERPPIPQQTVHAVAPDGRLGNEIVEQRTSKDGVIREIEIDAILDIETAKRLHDWLGRNIKAVVSLNAEVTK